MLTTLIGLAPVLGAAVSGIVALGGAIYAYIQYRRAANNTPQMQANAQAKTDLSIEEKAEQAVQASDKGDLNAERIGDAE